MRSNILDLEKIASAMELTLGVGSMMYARQMINVNYFFLLRGIVLEYVVVGNHKVILHMYGEPNMSLETLRNWIVKTESWLFDHTDISCILVFCKQEDMKLRFLVRETGAERSAIIPNADGDKGELLYVYSKDSRDKYERRVTCQQQYQ